MPDERPRKKKRTATPKRSTTPRMSVTLKPKTARLVRTAAALADLEVSEWCRVVIAQAAAKTVDKAFPNLGDKSAEEDDD